MKTRMHDVFEAHVRRWVDAWKAVPKHAGARADAEELLQHLRAELPRHVPLRLGLALDSGVLQADQVPGRGYFIGAPGDRSHTMLTRHLDRVWPCKEMFIHMAEYAALAAMVKRHPRLAARIEDRDMDLTVRHDDKLVAYIEVKQTKSLAERLVRDLLALEGKPIPPAPAKRQGLPDAQKKANYLLDDTTCDRVAFAVRAGGDEHEPIFERHFIIVVDRVNRTIAFEPLRDPAPLYVELAVTELDLHRAQACLAWHLERTAPVMIARGGHGDYLVYRDQDATLVLVGGERRGSIYTVLEALNEPELHAFETCLREKGLTLGNFESGRSSRGWKHADGRALILEDQELARDLGAALGKVIRS